MRRTHVYLAATGLIAGLAAVAVPASAKPAPPPPSTTSVVTFQNPNYYATEGNSDGQMTVAVVRNISSTVATVVVNAADGSASALADYSPAGNQVVTFQIGQTAATALFTIKGDLLDEVNETVNLSLTTPSSNAQLGKRKTAKLTINDDDPSPSVSVADGSATEGNDVEFVVSLTSASPTLPISVAYATSSGTATSGTDFTSTSGSLVWGPGDATTRSVFVPTASGDGDEAAETFALTLSSLVNVSAGDLGATGTISDTDTPPTISIADDTSSEGDDLSFSVTLSGVTAEEITIPWSTSGVGTATAYNVGDGSNTCAAADADNDGTDYVSTNTFTVTFPAGTSGPQNISVVTCEDDDSELDETMVAELGTPSYGTLDDWAAVGTIDDDDVPTATISNNPTVDEGDNAVYTVVLSGPQSHAVTVTIEADQQFSQAQPPGDHGSLAPVVLNFAPGDVSEDFTVGTIDDATPEGPEILWAEILSATGATVPAFTTNLATDDGWSLGTINSDEVGETEPNDWFGAANAVTGVMYGTIETGGANDWYSFVAGPTGNVTISTGTGLTDTCTAMESDPVLELFDTDGTTSLEFNDDGGTFLCDLLNETGLTPGATYFIRVGHAIFFNDAADGDDYSLTVVSP